jgi:hypothetical protein
MLKYNLCIIYASGYSWGLLHFLNNIGDHQELKVHLTYSLITEAGPFYTLVITHFYKIIPFTYITQTINMIYRLMCFQNFYLILFCVFSLTFLFTFTDNFFCPCSCL